jgi:hypothetical protein
MSDIGLGTQVAVIASELKSLAKLVEKHVEQSDGDIDALDKRLDRQDRRMAYLAGAAAVLIFLGQILAPVVSSVLALPGN